MTTSRDLCFTPATDLLGARVNRPYGEGPAWIELSIDA